MGVDCRYGAQMVEVYFILRSILVLRALAVPTLPTDEILPILAVPAVHNLDILEAQGVSTGVANPEILRARTHPQ